MSETKKVTDKKKILIGILLAAFAFAGFGTWAWHTWGVSSRAVTANKPTAFSSTTKEIVYYFHNTFRCETCINFETYTKAELEKDFSGELKDGTLTFQVVNVDEKGNEHFIQDYQLKTKSVVLVAPGEKSRWKNLERIWDEISSEARFKQYIQTEVSSFLAGGS